MADIRLPVNDTDTVTWVFNSPTDAQAAVRKQMSLTSDSSGLKLSGDAATPGNSKYYGTNSGGTKGWFDLAGSNGPLTTKGDLFGFSTLGARIPIGTNGQVLTADSAETLGLKWATPATGSVSSVSFTGGLISVADPTTTPALTVAGTSGGIPYFSGSATWASSAALTAHGVVVGGGAATAPTSTAVGTAGHVLTSNGAGSDPTFQAVAGASMSIGGSVTSGTTGSILFVAAGPVLGQSNTELFWDGDQLGVGINSSLSGKVHVRGVDDNNSFIKVDINAGAAAVLGVDNTPSGLGYVGTSTNSPFHLYSNNTSQAVLSTGGNLELSTGNFSVGTLISTAHLSIQKSDSGTGPGVNIQMRNTNTSTNSFTILQMQGNNTTVTGHLVVDGLGSGSILGAAGAYVGTFSNHPFGIDTNNTLRMSISNAGVVNIANLTASRPVFTDASKNLVSGSAGANFGPAHPASITVVNGIVTAVS